MGAFSRCKRGAATPPPPPQERDPGYYPPAEERREYPRAPQTNLENLRIADHEHTQFVRGFGSLNNAELRLERLRNCVVVATDNCKAVSVDECEGCNVIVASCSGSVFVRDSRGVRLAAVCQQFRARDCAECAFYLHVATDPVVEACDRLVFCPFMFSMARETFD